MTTLKRATPFLAFGILIFGGCHGEAAIPTGPAAGDESARITGATRFSRPEGTRLSDDSLHFVVRTPGVRSDRDAVRTFR